MEKQLYKTGQGSEMFGTFWDSKWDSLLLVDWNVHKWILYEIRQCDWQKLVKIDSDAKLCQENQYLKDVERYVGSCSRQLYKR